MRKRGEREDDILEEKEKEKDMRYEKMQKKSI